MSDLQEIVELAVLDKLIEFSMYECKSLYNVEMMYNHYVEHYSQIYRNPQDHLTKIMVMAYKRVIKEYENE